MNTEEKMNPDNMPLTWLVAQGNDEQREYARAELERERAEAKRIADERAAKYAAQYDAERPERERLQRLQREREVQSARYVMALNNGVPELHLEHVFKAAPKETDAIKAVRKWLASDKRILVLSGGVDAGKSGAAAWACIVSGGRFVTADKLRLAFGFGEDAENARRRLERAELLAIDDMGTEYADAKGFAATGLAALISARYDARRRTIITTNIDAATFKEQHERLASRIAETGTWFDCKRAGFRGGKK